MKKMGVSLLLTGLFITGCASSDKLSVRNSGFHLWAGVETHSVETNDSEKSKHPEDTLTDQKIATMLDANITAKLPCRLAIAKIENYCGTPPAELGSEEIESWKAILAKQSDSFTGLTALSKIGVLGTGKNGLVTLRDLRTAAARSGCELLLVYVQTEGSVDNFNDAAILYWTGIGLWLIPGNTVEHKCILQAILLDCRTGMILGTAMGDQHLKENVPATAVQIAQPKLAERAPKEALLVLQKNCQILFDDVVKASTTTASR